MLFHYRFDVYSRSWQTSYAMFTFALSNGVRLKTNSSFFSTHHHINLAMHDARFVLQVFLSHYLKALLFFREIIKIIIKTADGMFKDRINSERVGENSVIDFWLQRQSMEKIEARKNKFNE